MRGHGGIARVISDELGEVKVGETFYAIRVRARERIGVLSRLPDRLASGQEIAGERGDDRGLARPGLPQEPHDGRDRLCAPAGVLHAGGARPAGVAEQKLADGLPEPVEQSHDFPQVARQHQTVEPAASARLTSRCAGPQGYTNKRPSGVVAQHRPD
jgi:hypothetical protein